MRESESDGRLTRYVSLVTQMETQGSLFSPGRWRPVKVSCEQPEDGQIHVQVTPVKTAKDQAG
jgi:hypothetical protein